MTAPWSVDVEVASHSWTVSDLDPATPGPTAPLTMRHAMPDDQLWPAQPLPEVATFGLVAATAAELDDVVEGAEVHLTFTAPPTATPITFDGNVTDVEVEPVRFRPAPASPLVDGVRVAVTAIGYLAQLWEEPITVNETTATGTFLEDRLFNLFEATPWPVPAYPAFVNVRFGPMAALPLKVDGEALGPHLDQLLRLWLWDGYDDGVHPVQRLVVAPNLDPVTRELDPAEPWRLDLVSSTVTLTPSADLAETPTGWGVVATSAGAAGDDAPIGAGHIARGVKFVQRKRANVSKVIVPYTMAGNAHSVSVSNGNSPAVSASLGDPVLFPFDAADVATWVEPVGEFYLPAAHADAWGVETVTWALYADTPGRIPPALGTLVVVTDVPESVNPNGRGWITGLVRSWTLTLPDATVDLELATARGVTTPEVAGARLTWADMPATPTWADLRPDHTWEDYDLLRGP